MEFQVAFTGFFMNFYAVSALFNLVTAMLVGGFVSYRQFNRKIGRTFGLFAGSIAVWSFGYLMWQLSSNPEVALRWSRVFMGGGIFTTITFFHFTSHFTGWTDKYRIFLYGGYIIFVFFLISNFFTDYFISDLKEVSSFDFWPDPGILFHPFLVIWVGYAVGSIFLLYRFYKQSSGIKLYQTRYMLYGIIIGYIGGITNYFLWYDIPIEPFGTISASVYLSLVAYAVIKHNLFDMKVIFTELFSWLLIGIVFVNLLLSNSLPGLLKNFTIFTTVAVFAYLSIRRVYNEVHSRQKAEELTEDLKELNQEKSRMLSIASHQFRSPLTSIKGYASMIKDGSYGEVPDYLQEPVDRILKSSQQLAHIVDDFLNISRIEDGEMDYNFQEVDLKKIIKEVVEQARGSINEESQELSFVVDEDSSYLAEVDTGKFRQVVTNLVDNAIKYTNEGEIIIRLKQEEENLLVEVEDDGIGIQTDDEDKIFTQFARADNAQDINVSGSGLGLYIARKIINAHNGKIWATSLGKGQGSTFHVKLSATHEQ
jgi:signal transduction histidine kinase